MFKSFKQILQLCFIVIGVQFSAHLALADEYFASIPGDFNSPLVTQNDVNEQYGCVPTALLYMLKLGPGPARRIYEGLKGNTDKEKLETILLLGSSHISKITQKPLYDSSRGTEIAHNTEYMDLLAKEAGAPKLNYSNRMTNRYLDEKTPGRLARRIHSMILNSIEKSLPVLASIQVRTVDFTEKISSSHFSHVVVIVDVQRRMLKGDLGFTIQFLNPSTGQKASALIAENINAPFNAYITNPDDNYSTTWSNGEYTVRNFDNDLISNPYPTITMPTLAPFTQYGWEKRIDIFMRNLVVYTGH